MGLVGHSSALSTDSKLYRLMQHVGLALTGLILGLSFADVILSH